MPQQTKEINQAVEREGSPWTGLGAVLTKEMADQLTGARMRILEILILFIAAGTIFSALQTIQSDTSQSTQFLYLKLFTSSQNPLPAFVGFLGFLVPLIAIALAFDSVNGEFNRRTLSRVLAQPVYRDALLMGKFLACLSTLTVFFTAIWLLIFGVGIVRLGVPPTAEETWRALVIPRGDHFLWRHLDGVGIIVFHCLSFARHRRVGFHFSVVVLHDLLEHRCRTLVPAPCAETDYYRTGISGGGTSPNRAGTYLANHVYMRNQRSPCFNPPPARWELCFPFNLTAP